MSPTDPDVAVVRKGPAPARPRYQNHRVLDDAHGVITALETTPGSIAEDHRLLPLLAQHHVNSGTPVGTAVADHKYGTVANFVACQQQGSTTHLGELRAKQHHARSQGSYPDTAFGHDSQTNTVRCPAGQLMKPRRLHPTKHTWEYQLPKGVCAACALRPQCTRAVTSGRTIHRHEQHELLAQARAQAHSPAARRDRRRRQHLAEGSFADAANNHGFKRARWRRLGRVQIQDWLIAGIQNLKILLRPRRVPVVAVGAAQVIPFPGRRPSVGSAGGRPTNSRWFWLRFPFAPVAFTTN